MDTTQLTQMVNWLDEQHRRDRTELTKLQQRLEAQTNEIQEQARRIKELEARLTGAQTQLHRFTQVDQALQNLKNEVTLLINAQNEELSKSQREGERARMTDRESFNRGLAEVRKELPRLRTLEENVATLKVEDQRVSEVLVNLRQEVAELNKDIDERTRGLPYLTEQRNHDNKRIAQLQQENVELFKRVEEMSGKQQMLEQKQQRTESQAAALPNIVNDMKRTQEQFIESLKLADADRQRQMRDWGNAFDAQVEELAGQRQRIQEFAATFEQTRRLGTSLEKFQEHLQREQNQVAELQRLAEERQKKELADFQADNEKRWKKQLLEWQFQWEQQGKLNTTVKDEFPLIDVKLKTHEDLIQLIWRFLETHGSFQLTSAQQWLEQIQTLVNQREAIFKEREEAQLQLGVPPARRVKQ